MRPLRLRHDPVALDPVSGRDEALPILRLQLGAEAGLAYVSVEVDPGGADRRVGGAADPAGGPRPEGAARALAEARRQDEARTVELRAEEREREQELRGWQVEIRQLAGEVAKAKDGSPMARLAELQQRMASGEERLRAIC